MRWVLKGHACMQDGATPLMMIAERGLLYRLQRLVGAEGPACNPHIGLYVSDAARVQAGRADVC